MSRVAKAPVVLPKGVEATLSGSQISVKGSKGNLNLTIHDSVEVTQNGGELNVKPRNTTKHANALAGTFRALVNNMVIGVTNGYQKKLELQGVGYRAKAQGKSINLTVGYSHAIDYQLPEGVTAETPTQTEIVITGVNKQQVGQVAAEIRDFRPPEPYKGKGIRYAKEQVYRKEAKKK